jgi:uncharacterized protein YggU (UPF0235/DUF167 family)
MPRFEADAVVLTVRLTPRASRDAIDGHGDLSDGRAVVLARVRAVPEKGAANKALEKLLADELGVARSAVSVTGGATSRLKQVSIDGDPRSIAAIVASWPKAG